MRNTYDLPLPIGPIIATFFIILSLRVFTLHSMIIGRRVLRIWKIKRIYINNYHEDSFGEIGFILTKIDENLKKTILKKILNSI